MATIEEFLKARSEEGLVRTMKAASWRRDGRIAIDGKEYLDLSSNDYLGLSRHPRLIDALEKALSEFGAGSGGSRLMSGDMEIYHKLEERIALFKKKEAALFFNSGYQANVGLMSALCRKGDAIFMDRLCHASLIDGAILSGASFFRFDHNDPSHLEELLRTKRQGSARALIVTETIFSMDGDRAPLKELCCLKERYGCELFVDEAHATGIFGKRGSGVVEEEELEAEVDYIMGTFSKALGCFGAYLAASRKVVDYLINTCRSVIYSTALPPAIASCNLAGLDLLNEEPWRRERLLEQAHFFRNALMGSGLEARGASQIIPLVIGDSVKTKEAAMTLKNRGYWVLPIRPPTVPRGSSRLRFSLTVNHTREILERLVDDIRVSGI